MTAIRHIVALWAQPGFHGPKRTVIENSPNLGLIKFNDRTAAIGIHPGPDLHPGNTETISFFQDIDYGGAKELVLGRGIYADLQLINFGGISSVRFNGDL